MVVDTLTTHPTISHLLKYLSTTLGRDKILRLIQYISRFLSYYLYQKGYSAAAIAPFDAVKKHFGMTRKLMRVGKNVESFKSAAIAADNKTVDPVLRYTSVGRHLGYAGYLTLDSLHYLDAAGIYKLKNSKKIIENAQRCWFAGLTFSIISSLYSLRRIQQRHLLLNKQDAEHTMEAKTLARDEQATKIQLVSDLCDITIPGYGLSMPGFTGLDDGIVGLAGSVSSAIGVWTAWKKSG